jgi:hypothetical protein
MKRLIPDSERCLVSLRYQWESEGIDRTILGVAADGDGEIVLNSGSCIWGADPALVCRARVLVDSASTHWDLSWAPAPKGPTPVQVQERTAALRGGEAVLERARDAKPREGISVELRCWLSAAAWDCPTLRKRAEGPMSELGTEACIEQIGLRLTGRTDGIQEVVVIYLHGKDVWELHISGTSSFGLLTPEEWLRSDSVSQIQDTCFIPRSAS